MSIQKLLLCLYPRVWRARYEDEFLVVLSSRPLSLREGIDIIRGAFDAHLHPCFGTIEMPSPEKMRRMYVLLRSSLLTIFCAYVAFILAGLSFQKMTEAAAFQEVARTQDMVGLTFSLVVIGAVVALLAVLVGGVPILFAAIKFALVRRRAGPLIGLAVPVLAFVSFLWSLSLLKVLFHPDSQLLSLGQIALGRGLFLGVLLASSIISAGAICFVVTRSEIPEKFLRFALPPSILATIAMGFMAVATLLWAWACVLVHLNS
ncbi:hypothetical protein KDW_36660 [Dictyobacter vulcani]|uniref:Uncharacterized protein n=1 Tax=Dictyobacter vulcani TaxID=2607529 RepID=A0A5J4KJ33_9CHLR|nr:hypothetical protein [Dictyobacter vulcani]GER89504.1 hypothetical protein KDW_36660 [Dictyobacter vulcani]